MLRLLVLQVVLHVHFVPPENTPVWRVGALSKQGVHRVRNAK